MDVYHVGDYLNTEAHRKILEGMMGKNYTSEDVRTVNEELPQMIRDKAHSATIVNFFYSEKDHTYREHIVDLKRDLEAAEISFTISLDDYVKHGDNGIYFSNHLKKRFCV